MMVNDGGEDYTGTFSSKRIVIEVDSPSETPKLANIACNSPSEGSLPDKQMHKGEDVPGVDGVKENVVNK